MPKNALEEYIICARFFLQAIKVLIIQLLFIHLFKLYLVLLSVNIKYFLLICST